MLACWCILYSKEFGWWSGSCAQGSRGVWLEQDTIHSGGLVSSSAAAFLSMLLNGFAWCCDVCIIHLLVHCVSFICFKSSLKIRGQSVEIFIESAQNRSNNAHQKSMLAAYASWEESLHADQVTFESNKILTLACIFRSPWILFDVPPATFFAGVFLWQTSLSDQGGFQRVIRVTCKQFFLLRIPSVLTIE